MKFLSSKEKMNYFFLEPKNIFLSMSNTTQWKTINKGSKRNDDFKECSLIDLLTNKKTCYFCVMNKCKNQEHDRYDQNLKSHNSATTNFL